MKKFLLPLLAIGFLQTEVHSQSLDQQYNQQKKPRDENAHCRNIRKKSQYQIRNDSTMFYFKADGTVDRTFTSRYGNGCILSENFFVVGRETTFRSDGGCRELIKWEGKNLYKYSKCPDDAVEKQRFDLIRIR